MDFVDAVSQFTVAILGHPNLHCYIADSLRTGTASELASSLYIPGHYHWVLALNICLLNKLMNGWMNEYYFTLHTSILVCFIFYIHFLSHIV